MRAAPRPPPSAPLLQVRAEIVVDLLDGIPTHKGVCKLYRRLYGKVRKDAEGEEPEALERLQHRNEIWEAIKCVGSLDKDAIRDLLGLSDLMHRLKQYAAQLRKGLGPNVLEVGRAGVRLAGGWSVLAGSVASMVSLCCPLGRGCKECAHPESHKRKLNT